MGFVLLQRGEDSSSWVRISRFKVAILGVDLVFWVLGFGFWVRCLWREHLELGFRGLEGWGFGVCGSFWCGFGRGDKWWVQ